MQFGCGFARGAQTDPCVDGAQDGAQAADSFGLKRSVNSTPNVYKMSPAQAINMSLLVLGMMVCVDPTIAPLLIIARKYGCETDVVNCIQQHAPESEPSCSKVIDAAKCSFSSCTSMKGTQEEKAAANLFVTIAKARYNCDITTDQFLGNGGMGVLQRPVWHHLVLLMVAALVKKMVV
ncbi:hypothetical protein ElyMa_005795600 [Elysia marginata]|uniref:Uncharacterized protein n=1 Tax=Elysia marginata TaxID=1093978 RepID=A0AAV4FV78_9GAST|nr:hypothetical protein ElyMa_005795600 [Elysia marginata]